jgi:hypothetical protein
MKAPNLAAAKLPMVTVSTGSMRDTGRESQKGVGNEALCPSNPACRINFPVDLCSHAGRHVFILESQESYARIRFTASRRLESLRGQCADKSTSFGPRGKSACEASVKLWRHCQRGGLIFRLPRTGAPIAPSRRYSPQNYGNPFRPAAVQYCRRNGACKQENKCGRCSASCAHCRTHYS